jgi:PAS domain S-box-containing protein
MRVAPGRQPTTWPAYVIRLAVLTALYALTAHVGLHWATFQGAASPVFPAAGVALAGLLLGGTSLWPAILIGRMLAFWAQPAAYPIWVAVAISGGNALAAVAGAWVLTRHARLDLALSRLRDVLSLIGWGALGSSLVAASIGASAVALSAPAASFALAWTNWWVGNVSGVLLVTPLVLAWWCGGQVPRSARFWLHLGAAVAAATIVSGAVFMGGSPLLRTWLVFPTLIWAALAFGIRGAAVAMLPAAALSIYGTTMGSGPLAEDAGPELRFVLLQQFIVVASISSLVMAIVADERRGKEALQEREARLRLALAAGRSFAFEYDARTDAVVRTAESADILGLPANSATHGTGSAFFAMVHPDDREPFRRAFLSRSPAAAQQRLQYRVVRPDGRVVFLDESSTAWFDDAEGMVRVFGVAVDVTQRTVAEQNLERQERLLRTITDNADSALVLLDLEGTITRMNPAFTRITGYTETDAEGKTAHELVHHRYPDGRPFPIEECPIDRSYWNLKAASGIEETFVRKDGTLFPVVVSVAPLDQDGRPAGAVVEFRDVTLQKQVEREREVLLERERAARAEAERANILKDEFLATLSHELRTPLNAILGWTQILQSTPADAATSTRALGSISRNARLQAQLVDDLLDMSRVSLGKLVVNVQPTKLATVVEQAIAAVTPAAAAKGIAIQSHLLSLPDSRVAGDPDRLQQVFWNLLTNAVKFTPAGGTVRVRLESTSTHVSAIVEDTGQGIAADFLPFVFERFRQADGSTTRRHGGLGIGLSLVRQLVELHGGSVRAESAGLGEGARFTVMLPAARSVLAREAAPAPPPAREGSAPACGTLAGVRVVILDDEPDAREIAAMLLAECGADVECASDVGEALALVTRHRPNVVLADLGMPGRDGFDFVSALRALHPVDGGATPAVAVTALARPEDRERARTAGFDAHLPKPIDAAELVDIVARLSGRAGDPPAE